MKFSFRRIMSLVLTLVMVLSMIPSIAPHAHAKATALTTSVTGLTASWDYSSTNKNGTVTASGDAITIKATGGSLRKTKIVLTLTNNLGEEATLRFSYTKDGGTVSGVSTTEKVLANGASATITFESGRSQTNFLYITGISLIGTTAADPTITFMPGTNGSYTVNGTAITAETTKTVAAGTELALAATPASGYQFFGWQKADGSYLSQNASYTLAAGTDETITPVFISSSVALFGVGAQKFMDLTEAGAAAAAGTNKTIILLNNGTVSGSHTIPKGTTLLIPYDDANKAYGANASCTSYTSLINNSGHIAWETPSAYRTMTLAADAQITVNGNIEVGGRHAAAGGKLGMYGGSPTGNLGYIHMLAGSHMDLNSGANLYCWGYVYGDGTITAKNGASIYENFQIMDFRGGSITSELAANYLVFPLSQYYVQNVEVATRYEYGSTEYIATSIFMSNQCHSAAVKFIGKGAMFQPTSGSYFIKDYNPATDMLEMHAYGDSAMASMNLELGGTAIDSGEFVLPITNNIAIYLHSGTTTLNQNMMMLPGSKLTIDQDATLNLTYTDATGDVVTAGGYVLQVFDSENWTKALNMDTLETETGLLYCQPRKQFQAIPYTCTTRKIRTTADLTDVTIDINGTVVTDGFMYSTVSWQDAPNEDFTIVSGGANVISSGKTGVVAMNNGAGQDMLGYMFDQAKASYYFIPLASVQLKNGDGSMLDTTGAEAGTVYNYCATHDCWYTGECEKCNVPEYTITFYDDEGNELDSFTIEEGATPSYSGTPAKNYAADDCHYYEFKGWATSKGGEVVTIPAATADATYYAVFELKTNENHDTTVFQYTDNGDGTHKKVLACCGELVNDKEGCTDTNPKDHKCDYCGYTMGGHEYTLDTTAGVNGYTWSADGKTCTAHGVCDCGETTTANATVTSAVTTPSTCTVKGTTTYTANFEAEWAVDGQTTTRQDVALAEHTPGEAVEEDRKDATCGTDGSYNSVVYCAKCGKKLSTTPTTIPATGEHVDGDDRDHDCDNCDATNVDDGHHGGTATCTDKAVCDECGESYGSVDEDNHDWFKTTYTNITATHHTVSYICKHDATHIKNDAPVEHTYVNGVCVCTATKSYTIKWDTDGDGHVDKTTTAAHGTVPTAPSADKNDTAEFDYTFSHWVDEDGNEYTTIPAATGDVTYTAVFTSAKQVYTITWIVEGESSTTTVAYGETPVYNGTPSKAPTAEYSYTFVGWTPAVTAVTGNAEYTAKFEAVPNTYKVIYMVNGEKVHEDSFDYSAAVTAWAGYTAPEGYTFDGWDNVPATMPARDVTVTGTITIKSYTITWLDYAGNLIDTTTVKHGETPTHADANKAETAQYTYTFAGWTPEIVAATGEATYTATFTPVLRSYDITFVVDGVETKVSTKFGETPVYPNGTPTKAADAYYSYEFAGWDAVLAPVSGEATYTATWTKTPVEYTITFVIDGVEGTFYQVKGGYGTDVTYNVPSTDKTGYTFNGWDKELPATFPAENVTITGSYTVNQYTITFKGDFNTEKDDAFVDYKITKNYGEAITAEDIAALNATLPTITGWELLGWYYAEEFEYEEADEPVWEHTDEYQIPATMGAENVTVYAKWDAIVYQLTVKSSIDNIDMIYGYMRYEESYETLEEFNSVNRFCYDDSCVEEGCLCLLPEGYTFAGYKYENGTEMTFPIECWPAEEVTIIAQFEPIDYTITFMSEGVEVGKITAPYGSDITAQVAAITATKEGYKFNCWMNEAGKCVTFTTMPLNGMTVTADFTVNEYLVNFFASEDDTTAYDSIKVEYGADLNVEELLAQVTGTPEKDGHTWTGWNTANVPATMPAETVNIYGTWNVNKYTITFFGYVDGEEKWAVYQYKYDYNSSVNLDWKTMSKMGYDTVKLTDRDNVEATIPTTMPAENLVYRLWLERKPYTITFDTDGGSAIENLTVIYESAIEWPADPTKAGHTFQGWDMNGDGQVDTLPATMPFNNLNLKAVWAKDTVYIKWIIDGKEITQDYKYGDAITAPEATKAADAKWTYKFTGWDAEIPATATTNATYTAQFEQDEAVKYTVKFVNGENTVYETQIAWNGQVTLDGFTAPTMEGNTLTWTVDGAEAEFPYTMTTAEVTFVVSWTPITYTITADGEVKEFTYGTAVSIADPTKEGHTFAGWLKDGVAYELPETMPAENIVITSAWTVNTYTLTVDVQATNDVVKLTVPYGANLLEVLAKAAEDGEIPAIGYSDRVSDEYFNGERVVSGYTYWVDDAIGWGEVGETLNMPASDFDIVQGCTGFGWYFYYDNDDAYIGADFYDKENEWLDGWQYIEEDYDDVAGGAWYYFAYAELDSGDGCWIANFRAEDITLITKDGVEGYYAFDHESGKWLNTYTGIYTASNGDLYYVENGIAVKNKGMVQVDDPAVENGHLYYYFGCGDSNCTAVGCAGEYKAQRGISHWTEITNGYLVLWGYEFNQDGTIVHDEDTSKNGVHLDDGVKYYYIDGVKVHYGLFIGEDGEYYYARSNGSLVVGRDYWISGSHLNGVERDGEPVKEGTYTFDEEGRIVWPTSAKNGVYAENGSLYYYEDGARVYAGLIKHTGSVTNEDGTVIENVYVEDLIYVRTSGELAVNRSYWSTKNNGVMPSATYNFDEYGRMIRTNGFVKEDGGIYYYVNGNRYHAGLIKVDGDFYYVKSSGQVVTGCRYWITYTNGYEVKEGSYEFADDGKVIIPEPEIVKNGIVEENGALYYYVDGKLNYAGLIQYTGSLTHEDGTVTENAYEDAWIYVRTSGELVVGRSYWVTKHNDLLEKSATYQFDENGVMQNAPM